MMRPQPALRITGATARAQIITPLMLTRITRSHSSCGMSSNLRFSSEAKMPALLMRTSIRPCSATTASTIVWIEPGSPTSTCTAIALPARASISATTLRALSRFRSATTGTAPAAANCRASSRPMPCPAPVIRTTRSLTPKSRAHSGTPESCGALTTLVWFMFVLPRPGQGNYR